jgi:hypothetical protein
MSALPCLYIAWLTYIYSSDNSCRCYKVSFLSVFDFLSYVSTLFNNLSAGKHTQIYDSDSLLVNGNHDYLHLLYAGRFPHYVIVRTWIWFLFLHGSVRSIGPRIWVAPEPGVMTCCCTCPTCFGLCTGSLGQTRRSPPHFVVFRFKNRTNNLTSR